MFDASRRRLLGGFVIIAGGLLGVRPAHAQDKTDLPPCYGRKEVEGWIVQTGSRLMLIGRRGQWWDRLPDALAAETDNDQDPELLLTTYFHDVNGNIEVKDAKLSIRIATKATAPAPEGLYAHLSNEAGLSMIVPVTATEGEWEARIKGEATVDPLFTAFAKGLPVIATFGDGRGSALARVRFSVRDLKTAFEWGSKDVIRAYLERKAGRCSEMECFVTTAVAGVMGLADNCWELRTLRALRDRHVVPRHGPGIMQRYREVSEAALKRLGQPDQVWRLAVIYYSTILPCAVLAALRCDRAAAALYMAMALRLARSHATEEA